MIISHAGSGGIYYIPSKRTGQQLLVHDGIRYFRNRKRDGKQYWKCSYYYKNKCPAFMMIDENRECYSLMHEHTHDKASSKDDQEKSDKPVKNLVQQSTKKMTKK